MAKKKSSIKRIFTQFIIFSICLPIFILGLTEILISIRVIRDELSGTENRYIRLLVDYIEYNLKNPLEEVDLLSDYLKEGGNDEVVKQTAEIMLTVYPHIRAIELVDREGIIRDTYPESSEKIGYDISGNDYFVKSRSSEDVHWSSSYYSSDYNEALVSIIRPYTRGYILLHLSLSDLKDLTNESVYEERGLLYSISDQHGVYISHMDSEKVLLRENNVHFNRLNRLWDGRVIEDETVLDGDLYFTYNHFLKDVGWMVTLYKSRTELLRPVYIMVVILLVMTFMLLSIGVVIGQRISRRISSPVNQLVKAAKQIIRGDFNISFDETHTEELDLLANTFKSMSFSVKDSQRILEKELQESKEKLILSEKMAALGGMVAGVSHEINTPVGIIVTSSSFLEQAVKEMIQHYSDGTLSKSQFDEFCEKVIESSKIIMNNSSRAADLIKSFKAVAVDQTSMDKRIFKLREYTYEILQSVHYITKKKDIEIKVDCPPELAVYSYPGSYSQVLNNLIINSAIHGFPGNRAGKITITMSRVEDKISLIYRDTGIGIEPEHLKKIFDPFFTTKRDDGGSGLGMNIVYNVVHENLKGDISCSSKLGEWTEFRLTFPVELERDIVIDETS